MRSSQSSQPNDPPIAMPIVKRDQTMPWDKDKAMTSSYYLALGLFLVVAAICLLGRTAPAAGHAAPAAPASPVRCVLWGNGGVKR